MENTKKNELARLVINLWTVGFVVNTGLYVIFTIMAFTPLRELIGAVLLTITLVRIAVIIICDLFIKVHTDGEDTSYDEDISDDE